MKFADIFRTKKKHRYCSAVILAAGFGERMGTDKMMLELQGKPVFLRSVLPFEKSEYIDEIIVVTRADSVQTVSDICSAAGLNKVKTVISGGNTRTESALAGVSAVNSKCELISIHDGARPFVTDKIIKDTVESAADFMAAVPVVPSVDTVKIIDEKGIIVNTPERSCAVSVQTPQVFHSDIIKGALTAAVNKGVSYTDDSSAVEMMGAKVHTVSGNVDNIKITYPEDLVKADSILKIRGE